MTATITTVIPTFRRPVLLGRAIRSVLAQTYRDCAVAVFDNASGDETSEVVATIASVDPRVSYYCHERNVGGLANFMYAMSHVASEFFSVLSDDDVLFPEFFETAMRDLRRYPQTAFFAGSTLEYDAAGRLANVPMAYWPREGLYAAGDALPFMLGNRHPTWTGILFRRSLIDAIGIIDPQTGPGGDFDYEVRAAARFPVVISYKPCAAWLNHAQSQSGRETVAIIPCYEKMLRNMEAVDTLPARTKERVLRAFRAQIRGKLLEISVKAQVRGDTPASREAALLLRDHYGSGLLGTVLLWMSAACSRVPALQRLLQWMEGQRLRIRAAASRRRATREHVDLDRYAEYMRAPT